jgi:glucan 1,3-beta-glucosidase
MWNDYTQWNDTVKASVLHFTKGSMDALQNWFFWTWKIGNSTGTIAQVNPFWHYRLGLANGWIPTDPRQAIGTCAQDGVSGTNFDGTYSSPYMTGGAGAGTIAAAQTSSYPWPPVSFANVASSSMKSIPQYTQTGTPITMPAMTFTAPSASSTINAGTGWYKANDASRQAYAAISGWVLLASLRGSSLIGHSCAYPAEYSAGTAVSANACGAGLSQAIRRAAQPAATAPPS